MSNLAFKLGEIGPKWEKSGTFKDQFRYILARSYSGEQYDKQGVQKHTSVISPFSYSDWHQIGISLNTSDYAASLMPTSRFATATLHI